MNTKRKLPRWIQLIEADSEGSGGGEDGANGAGDIAGAPAAGAAGAAGAGANSQNEDKLGEGGIKALHAERARAEAAEKTARDAQAALDAERNAHTATRQSADEAKGAALKYEVAAAKGIPADLVPRLVGTTREELEADADKLRTHIAPMFVPPVDPTQGKGRVNVAGGTVEAGKSLYQELRGKKSKN